MATLQERGFFWWFDQPDLPANSKQTSIPGQLTITDEGKITLEVEGAFTLHDVRPDWRQAWLIPGRVIGQLAPSGDYVLLEELERTDSSLPGDSPQRQNFSAALCTKRDMAFRSTFSKDEACSLRIELTGRGLARAREHPGGAGVQDRRRRIQDRSELQGAQDCQLD
jgi:hypothetical protein